MGNASNQANFYPRLRVAWAERRALLTRRLNQGDLVEAFGISKAQASADIQTLQEVHPGCLVYDTSARCYRWTGGQGLVTDCPYPVLYLDVRPMPMPTIDDEEAEETTTTEEKQDGND